MRGKPNVFTALAWIVAAICAVGWFRAATAGGTERDFSTCERSGGTLTLTYVHSPGQGVEFERTPHGNGDVTVSYRTHTVDGNHVASAVINTIQFDDLSGKVYHPDGREVSCRTAE